MKKGEARGPYKIRKFTTAGGQPSSYALTVPIAVKEVIPDDMLFEIELTNDGILYKPVGKASKRPEVKKPRWAK